MRRLKRREPIATVEPLERWQADFGVHGEGRWSGERFLTGFTIIMLGGREITLSFGEEFYEIDERL